MDPKENGRPQRDANPCVRTAETTGLRATLVWTGLLAPTALVVPGICMALDLSDEAEAVQAMLLGRYDPACAQTGPPSPKGCFSPQLTLPDSTAEQALAYRTTITVRKDQISVDGTRVMALDEFVGEDGTSTLAIPDDEKRGMLVSRLYDRLLELAEAEKDLMDARKTLAMLAQRDDLFHQGELLVSVDGDVPFSVVREVLYTAGQAQYGTFLFVAHNPWEQALTTIESSLPAIGPPRTDYDEQPPLNLSIVVSDQGLSVMGADAVLFPDGHSDSGEDADAPTLPCLGGAECTGIDDYDWAELGRLLGSIKDQYPDDLRVIVVPESQISFEVLVRVLDHARWAPHIPIDAERGAWEYWQSVRRELFPLSTLAGGAI